MKGTALVLILTAIGLLAASGCVSAPAGPAPGATITPVSQEGRPQYFIGVDADYWPFTYQDSTGNFTGFDVEAARWIAARKGFDAVFIAVPWDGIIPALQTGTVDMIYSGMTITPDRQKSVDFTRPYYSINQSIATRSGSNFTMQDFYAGRLRIGAQEASTGAAWVEENLVRAGTIPPEHLVLYPTVPALSESLAKGTVDAIIGDAPSQKQGMAGTSSTLIGEIPTKEQYAIAVRKNDQQVLGMMDDGLRQLMEDPYWQQLLRKYDL